MLWSVTNRNKKKDLKQTNIWIVFYMSPHKFICACTCICLTLSLYLPFVSDFLSLSLSFSFLHCCSGNLSVCLSLSLYLVLFLFSYLSKLRTILWFLSLYLSIFLSPSFSLWHRCYCSALETTYVTGVSGEPALLPCDVTPPDPAEVGLTRHYTGWPRSYRKYILQITQPSQHGYAKL